MPNLWWVDPGWMSGAH